LIALLPSIASARVHFFWGFHFGVPVVAPAFVPPVAVVAPPIVVAPAAVTVAGPEVVYAPARPAFYFHRDYDFGYRPWGYAHYHYWHWR
jgi:hypothetical protein